MNKVHAAREHQALTGRWLWSVARHSKATEKLKVSERNCRSVKALARVRHKVRQGPDDRTVVCPVTWSPRTVSGVSWASKSKGSSSCVTRGGEALSLPKPPSDRPTLPLGSDRRRACASR